MDNFGSLILFLTILSCGVTNEVLVNNPDMSEIYRPCCFTDVQCIREEFLKRNWFVDTTHLPSDPFSGDLFIPEIKIDESFFNLTIVLKDSKFGKLSNVEVVEFYVNNRTNRAVLSLAFSNFTVDSKATMLTTTMITGLSPCTEHKYETHARITNDLPKYDLGCGLDELDDPEVRCLFKTFNERITVAIQGSSLQLSPVFATYYMAALTKPRPTCDNVLWEDEPSYC
uniref:Fibrohexamerin-3 n=1 Tax=Tineola bisselliella TaxID=93883 RepID=A0A891XH14_TINBI|nr:fibrohexamerin-3 [Tineola bisselliella]